MLTGTLPSGERGKGLVPIGFLCALGLIVAGLCGWSVSVHGAMALDPGWFIAAAIGVLAFGLAVHGLNTRFRTVCAFEYDGATLWVRTLGFSGEQVYKIGEVARVQYGGDGDVILFNDRGWLRLPAGLADGVSLAEQVDLDSLALQAALAGGDPTSVDLRAVRQGASELPAATRRQAIGVVLFVLAAVLFGAGFYFGGGKQRQSGIQSGYRAEYRDGQYYAVKHRGGKNPPRYEIDADQYRLWREGEETHSRFIGGAVLCFVAAFVLCASSQSRLRRR